MTDDRLPISKLKLDLDDEGLSETFLLRNGEQMAIGLYCDLGPPSR